MSDGSDPGRKDPNSILLQSCVARDLHEEITGRERGATEQTTFSVIIEMNNSFRGGARMARAALVASYLKTAPTPKDIGVGYLNELLALAKAHGPCPKISFDANDVLNLINSSFTESYLFGKLSLATIRKIALACSADREAPVYKIWLDQPCEGYVYRSHKTVKCDAARVAFGAQGEDIVWAVADTGIDGNHRHFATHQTLKPLSGVNHFDFTSPHDSDEAAAAAALRDEDGHGTHVAGIIAGETCLQAVDADGRTFIDSMDISFDTRPTGIEEEARAISRPPDLIQGVAPRTRLVSLKVLSHSQDKAGISRVVSAIGYIQRLNEYGRNIRIHGLNLSLGYMFDPTWFGAGQSPVCKEVNRLVKSGVVVVVAAGNGGFSYLKDYTQTLNSSANASTISDPGNAELAITVGSTHRDRPHEYGVSFFSSKGPTADGRMKPDILAPGERIVSCQPCKNPRVAGFRERSGTSMAAPHVSGLVAALLSVRREFIGQPERVKKILMSSATDLGRLPSFQGAGVADLMRALQSI